MSEVKLGFVVNTRYRREGNVAQKIHLLIVRILLYYCYSHKYIQWGYHLFRSGRTDISYKKISLQSISLKPAQKLLTDLVQSISNPRSGPNSSTANLNSAVGEKNEGSVVLSWEEVLTLVLSDFSWDQTSTNILFILSSSVPGDSDKIRSIILNLKREKRVEVIFIDINPLEDCSELLDQTELNNILHGKYSSDTTRIIPTHVLSSDLSHLWFRQIFKWHLTSSSPTRPTASTVTFINNDVITILDDDEEEKDETMTFLLSPFHSDCQTDNAIVSLTFKKCISYTTSCGYLSHRNCYFVVFDEGYSKQHIISQHSSFLVESQELEGDKKDSKIYLIKHLNPSCGVMFGLLEGVNPDDVINSCKASEDHHFDLSSFHELAADDMELTKLVISFSMRDNRFEIMDNEIMEDIFEFHRLHIADAPALEDSKHKIKQEVDIELETLPNSTAECATEEAMAQSSPRYYQRSNIAGLVRKFQNDIKLELTSPSKLKDKHQLEKTSLIKEHKIQVVLHLIWYSEFSSMTEEAKEETKTKLLSLLRSLSFLASPTEMFKFLSDQIVEEFQEDCQELLRELYEDGFLMEAPDLLCSDSNSLTSSILSTHGQQAPLYCEDSSSMSNDLTSSTQTSTLSRQRSWMDPCQLSQSSFSIAVPKKKNKKQKDSLALGSKSEAAKIAARIVASQKQTEQGIHQGRCRYLSAEITPDEMKQSSKRRKLTRKNSVLDTPLKKQVKNPTTAKTSRARQRVDITPQKCTSIVQIQESPIRGGSGRASSFFGSQTQPPAARSFVIKDGFKTPNRLTHSSSTEDIPGVVNRSPGISSPGQCFAPPSDSNSRSQHGFTPPGTPRSGRKFVKKLSYNSPMRALFVTHNNVTTSPRRKPLDSDYIHMMFSPSLDKENEPFFPTFKGFDEPKCEFKLSDALASTLEPIFNSRQREISEDAQMPTFESSPCQGTINLQTKGGFLKLLEDASHPAFSDKKCDSDNESDVSAASSLSTYKSILKSPFTRRTRKKRNVSFSLETDIQFSSDNESENAGNIFNLINLVDGSIKNDEMLDVDNLYGCEDLIKPSEEKVDGTRNTKEFPNIDSFNNGFQLIDSDQEEHTEESKRTENKPTNNLYDCADLIKPSEEKADGPRKSKKIPNIDSFINGFQLIDSGQEEHTEESKHTENKPTNNLYDCEDLIKPSEEKTDGPRKSKTFPNIDSLKNSFQLIDSDQEEHTEESKQTEDKLTDEETENNHTDRQTISIQQNEEMANVSEVPCNLGISRKRKRLVSSEYDDLSND